MLENYISAGLTPEWAAISVLLLFGILGLYYGAGILVAGSAELAIRLHVRPVIVGLTVVAFGTSAPELMVSLVAAFQGEPDVSVGNIVGSNIANIGLIIGLTAMLLPISRESKPSRFEFLHLFGVSALLILLCIDGLIGRVDGVVLFALLLVFLYWSYKNGSDKAAENVPVELTRSAAMNVVMVVAGLVVLPVAGQLMVTGATTLARKIGISELVIGITVVALGTSLPELATSMMAVARKQHDIGIGNIIGSNIFNICCVLGIVPMMKPLAVNPDLMPFHFPLMMYFTIIFIIFMLRSRTISRLMGSVLFISFVAYVLLSYLRA